MLKASVAFEANIDNEILIYPPNFIEMKFAFIIRKLVFDLISVKIPSLLSKFIETAVQLWGLLTEICATNFLVGEELQ